jgi:hypothetical protein
VTFSYHVYNGVEAVKLNLSSTSLRIFTFFVPVFTFENEISSVGFSASDFKNKQFHFKATAGCVQDLKKKNTKSDRHT